MWSDFRGFLTKSNALALAVGVIIGAAVGNVVSALVADILMPLISLAIPGGDWRKAKWTISGTNAVLYGHFAGVVIDFVIICLKCAPVSMKNLHVAGSITLQPK